MRPDVGEPIGGRSRRAARKQIEVELRFLARSQCAPARYLGWGRIRPLGANYGRSWCTPLSRWRCSRASLRLARGLRVSLLGEAAE